MDKDKKSQVAVEFMMIIAFLMLILVGFLALIGNQIYSANKEYEIKTINSLKGIVIGEIHKAATVEDGYSKEFRLPRAIGGLNYTMTIENNTMLLITYNDAEYAEHLPEDAIGKFHLPDDVKGSPYYKVNIRKEAGIISVSLCNNCTWSYAQCYYGSTTEGLGCDNMTLIFPGFGSICCGDYDVCC